MSFVNLHSHSDFSLLDGAATADMRAHVAKELGQTSLALTDHGTISGIPAHLKACRKEGIKPVVGIEAYFVPDSKARGNEHRKSFHLILLAKNEAGFKNLIKLSTMAYSDGFYGKPRMDYDMLKRHSEGLIASSACISGYLPWAIQQNNDVLVHETIEKHLEIFGRDYYFEIQPHDIPAQRLVNQSLASLALDYNIPVQAAIDSHVVYKDWMKTQDVILMIATGQTREKRKAKKEAGEDVYGMAEDIDTLHFMGEQEVVNSFKKYQPDLTSQFVFQSVQETQNISDKIEEFDLDRSNKMPKLNKGEVDAATQITRWCYRRLNEIGKSDNQEYLERLEFELSVMKKLDAFDYMLLVANTVKKARAKGIRISDGRGSAAGALVSYLIGIITINPIGHGLSFERFMNPERQGMPDIDLDFQDDRRDEVKDIIIEEHGAENVANIGAFGTYKPRGVIKDVGKVLDIPFPEVNAITKTIPDGANTPDFRDVVKQPEVKALFDKYPEMLEHCWRIGGGETKNPMVRNISQHAAGVVICSEPVTNFMPMVRAKEEKDLVSGWTDSADLPTISDMGFLKIDVLSIAGLTKQAHAINSYKEETGEFIDLDSLPVTDDPAQVEQEVMEVFRKGLTLGIWQFSSSGITNFLKKIKPTEFRHLVAANAMYRPGFLDGGDVDAYARRKNGEEPVTYWHDSLKPFLEETYGLMVYQEQMMDIVKTLGGFSNLEADDFRKACSKLYRQSKEAARAAMGEYKPKWDKNTAEKGIEKSVSEFVWDKILATGSYSFNKSHAASYALLAYKDAHLKTHIKKHFYSALMTGSKDSSPVIREAKMMGLDILPPDINKSGADFTITEDSILYGLESVKHVGANAIEEILEHRPFKSSEDMRERCIKQKVNKTTTNNLIGAGAFDFAGERDHLDDVGKREAEEVALGFALSGTGSSTEYKDILDPRITVTEDFDNIDVGSIVVAGGEITNVKEITTRRGEPMAFVEVTYQHNVWDVTVFSDKFWQYNSLLKEGSLVILRGKKDSYNEDAIIMDEMASLKELKAELG